MHKSTYSRERYLKYQKKWRQKAKAHLNEWQRNYRRTRIRRDPEFRARLNRHVRKYYSRVRLQLAPESPTDLQRRRVRERLRYAVERGTIKKPTQCENCHKRLPLAGHHYMGYDYPLAVLWLCNLCHGKAHWRP